VVGGIGEMIGNHMWEPGEFTDDTQMAIVQAESILTHGEIDGSDLFRRFQLWSTDAKDVGSQTRAVLDSDRSCARRRRRCNLPLHQRKRRLKRLTRPLM
jgi:ADP-ribosylglycohydrolase